MAKKFLSLLITVTLMAVLLTTVFAAQTAEHLTQEGAIDLQTESFMSREEFEVLSGINAERAKVGVDPITVFEKLQTVGDIRSSEIAVKYANDRPNGGPYYSALADAGITSYKSLTETYVKNYTSAASFVAAIMNTSGPAATAVNSKYYHCAVGYSYIDAVHYWTLMYYVNHACTHSGFELIVPSNLTFKNGTTINKMYLLGKTSCASCGTSYFPIVSEYCTGFDTTVSGKQTVTVTCFGESESFEVNMELEQIDPDLKPEELEMLLIINKERLAEGLNPVTSFPLLQKVGDIRSTEIAEYFAHERPDGRSCFTAIDDANVPACSAAGENIAGGQSTAKIAMDGFMNSPGHRANVLNTAFKHVALGYHYDSASPYDYHWSQMFYSTHTCNYSSMMLELPENMTFYPDCSIDDMGVLLRLYCDSCGVTFMPLNEELCTGYEPSKFGEQTITVNVFGLSSSFKINTLEHEHTYTTTTYTFCAAEGYTEHTCSECAHVYRDNFTPALGHDYHWYTVTAPTLTSEGSASAICYRCYGYSNTTLPMLNESDYEFTLLTEPTCTAVGSGRYVYHIDGQSLTYVVNLPKLDHSYDTVVTSPTCEEAGFTTYTCAACGESYVGDETEPTGHNLTDTTVSKEPTCTEDGEHTFTCTGCGITKTESIDALGHATEVLEAAAPTCTDSGLTEGSVCARCEEVLLAQQELAPLGHSYTPHITAPTCGESGFTTYICDRCGDSYVTDEVGVLGHSYDIVTTEPTCTEDGVRISTCTTCGDIQTEILPALGHSVVIDEAVKPDCTNAGLTEGEHCENCGEIYVAQETVSALGHDYEEYQSKPTCTEDGKAIYTCLRCSYSYSEVIIPAWGHSYDNGVVTVEPTCSAEGEKTYTCPCGDFYTESIPMIDHSYEEEHHKPTCTEDARIVYICSVCGDTYEEKVSDALGHSYYSAVTEPTCEEAGFTTYTCCFCGDSYITDKVEALGHTEVIDEAVAPTCTETGLTEGKHCSVCNEVIVARGILDALGHSYEYTESSEKHVITCENCDYNAEEDHSYVDGSCICGATQNTDPIPDADLKFNMNISAGAEMVVNYNFMASVVSKYVDFYLEVSKNVAGGEPVITTYGISADHTALGQIPPSGNALMYNAAYTGINAKEMGDEFATTLYAIDANGKVYKGETVVRSIKDFLLGKLEDESSIPELKTMAVDMLKYGAAAQINFGYDAENLVTDALTEEQLALGTQEVPEATDYATVTGNGANVSTSITVKSKVELTLSCISAGQADPTAVKCIIKDAEGKILAELATVNIGGVMYSATYDNVGAKEMRKVITATFYGADGTAISKTLNWSVESYVAQTRANAKATETEIATVNAMLTYGDSVARYMEAK